MSSFTSFGLAALLSTTAFALSPRQAPPNPGPCFNLQAQGRSEWVQINSGGGSNFTTGLLADRSQSTIFTLTDFVGNNFGALFAVNAPGSPSKSVPLYPNGAASAPITWFNVAEATAQSSTQTSLRCQRQASTDFLVCQNVPQFTLCSGTINGNTGATIPTGCAGLNLIYAPTTCPGPVTSSSMGMNSTSPTMSPTSSRNGTMTPTSMTTRPTNTLTPVAPGTIGNWNLLGCANSPTGFLGWVQVASTPIMTNEFCTVSCTGYQYAGTNGANCYCADELEDVSTTTYPNSCTAPCPGNLGQACGGAVPGRNGTSVAARQLNLFNVLLTTYVNLAFEEEVPIEINIGDIIVNVDVVVYVDVCNTCEGGLTTCTTTSTCTTVACGCETDVMPTIPLTTVTRPCDNCGPTGGPSTITVTIPVDVVTQQTQIVNPPGSAGPAPSTTMFMGGAPARREIGGVMGLIGAMAALLI